MSEAEIINSLNLGRARDVLANEPNSPLGELLTEQINGLIAELRESLRARDINTSRNTLSQSMRPTEVKIEGGTLTVGLSMEFYWKFINYGVNGTEVNHGAPAYGSVPSQGKSFKQSILEWIPARSVQLPPQFKDFDQFAYAIMTNIRKRGKAPRPFFDDVINEQTAEVLRGPIERVLKRSIEIVIVSPWQSQSSRNR